MANSKRDVFTGVAGFRKAKPEQLKTHVENVRKNVIPSIKEQLNKKEQGAERAKAYKVF